MSNELALANNIFQPTKTGLIINGVPSYDEWEEYGEKLSYVEGAIQWLIGDWLNYGEHKWGEMYAQAVDETQALTWKNYKWVSGNIKLSTRVDNLSWSHHREVADLPPEEQTRFLNEAHDNQWSVKELVKKIKEDKRNKQIAANIQATSETDKFRLILGDFSEEMKSIEGVSAIITDPPYPEEYLPLYGVLAERAAKSLKVGGSLIVMTGQYHLPRVISLMSGYLNYQWTLAYLTPGGQSPQIWPRKVNTFWKPILWFVKGNYTGDWIGDVCKSDTNDKRFHDWGQSESGMAELIERFTIPGDLILDPFCGGGTTGFVALQLERRFIGIDIAEDAIGITASRIYEICQK